MVGTKSEVISIKKERLMQLKFSRCMHISQIPWILYGADGVQANQEAEAGGKKKKRTQPKKKNQKNPTPMEELIYFFKR